MQATQQQSEQARSEQRQSEQPKTQPSMNQTRLAAFVSELQKNEHFWAALIVFIGSFFMLSAVPFYPAYVIIPMALVCGLLAVKYPPGGVILGVLLSFPAFIYQSPVFGWFYLVLIAAVLFEATEQWMIIATLEALVLAPFAFGGFPLFGWTAIAGMGMGALYFGSRKSIVISLGSVALILLLSSIWLIPNTAYLPIKTALYQPGNPALLMVKKTVDLPNLVSEGTAAFGAFLSFENLARISESLSLIMYNLGTLLFQDSLLLQLVGWATALFLLGFLPSRIKKRPQLLSSLSLIILIPVYFAIATVYGTPMPLEFVGGIVFAIAVLGILEYAGLSISRESEIERREKLKSYGKFGMADMSLGGEEKSMDDVGGYEDVKTELRDAIIMPLEKKEMAYAYGIKPPSGILLFGPPGTGKTMLMRALAKELKYNFIEVRCSQILSQWYGESEKNVAEIFSKARKNSPTILFFDELDSIAKKRSSESLDQVGPRVLSTMLQEIDGGTRSSARVMVIGATNLPSELDPAMLRPGRLDKIIYMTLPDPVARKAIFQVSLRKMPLAPDIDYDTLVRKTERFSGADIKNIVTEAKRMAAKEASAKGVIIPITMAHLLQVLESVRPSTGLAQLESYEQFRLDFERRVGAAKPKVEEKAAEAAVKWSDVAGLDEVKTALLEAIELPLLHEQEMKEMGVKPSKGILLFGPPGTGKTLIVRAAANELKASFQSVSGADLMKKGYTQAVSVIKETFNRARENTPALVFFDEIETFAPARGMGGASEIVGQFLTEMDGVKGLRGVVIIAATNKPALMDPAIMRPGRFDRIFYIPPPDEKGREDMFRIHLGTYAQGVDLKKLAAATPGFSGADIADVCQSAKMKSLRAKIAGKPQPISTDALMAVIRTRRPSITPTILEEYDHFLEAYGERK